MQITVRTFQVPGGFVVGYRREFFTRGVLRATTIEYVGRDCFWVRKIANAMPFSSPFEARQAAEWA